MAKHSSSPALCKELLAHPSMDSPLVSFVLRSNLFPQHKVPLEAVRLRSTGATMLTVAENFGVSKSRANQYVWRGIRYVRIFIAFDTQVRASCDLVGQIEPYSMFIARGLDSLLSRRGIYTWEQLANFAPGNTINMSIKTRNALTYFVSNLSAAMLQSDLTIGPVLQKVTALFSSEFEPTVRKRIQKIKGNPTSIRATPNPESRIWPTQSLPALACHCHQMSA